MKPQDLEKFQQYLNTLNQESPTSKKYIEAVTFLEINVYNKANFDTLELLSDIYKKNKDSQNQIKVLKLLVLNYPKDPRSHYKLGVLYKNIFLKSLKIEDKDKAIVSLNNSIINKRNYEPAYKELLPLLLENETHTKSSLALAIEIVRYIKKPENYIILCEAYFENVFPSQSQKACKKAMEKNPEDSKSQILYAISQDQENNRNQQVIDVAKKYTKSFYVQYKAGLFFMEDNPNLALSYLNTAVSINPDSLKLQQLMAKTLFNRGQHKESYDYFLKACLLSKGAFIREFETAKSKIVHKNEALLPLFTNGYDKCFNSIIESRKT